MMQFRWLMVLLLLCCSTTQAHEDPDSFANFNQVVSEAIALDLTVDFTRQRLTGMVEHQLRWVDQNARRVVLDSKDLQIDKVEYLSAAGQWLSTPYLIGIGDELRGQPLKIQLPEQTSRLRVWYATKPSSSALQWLSATQSTEKKQPFLYTQSQAIHARSWIPLQDTPARRLRYRAKIKVPNYLTAVMSADVVATDRDNGVYQFQMDQPVPSYLIALAVGDIHFKAIDERSGVYGEAAWLDEATREFADVSKLINAADELYGQFAWGRYDLLVLPSSFPFGGMEYPRIAFVTPTVLTGDRSLVSMVAHELAHAWSGNLVTNANWQHLWLNEGITSYVESRLMAKVYGQKRAEQELALNVEELKKTLASAPTAYNKLHNQWHGQDPEQAFNQVAYTKGMLFMRWLAAQAGIDEFDRYLQGYFQRHAFKSVDTNDFVADVQRYLIEPRQLSIKEDQLRQWLDGTDLPAFAVMPSPDTFSLIDGILTTWLTEQVPLSTLQTRQWTVQEWLYFLRRLPRQLSEVQLAELESNYGFSASRNAEIFTEWAVLVIPLRHPIIDEPLKKFLTTVGRVRYLEPLYRALANTPQKREWMRKIYRDARRGYHPQAQLLLDKIAL